MGVHLNKMAAEYLRCPYCYNISGEHRQKIPKTVGRYRIKVYDDNNVLIFQCQKCLKCFRMRFMGKILLWDDFSFMEKLAFKQTEWNKKLYKRKQSGSI